MTNGRRSFSSPPPNSSNYNRNGLPVNRGFNGDNFQRSLNNFYSPRGPRNNQSFSETNGQRSNGYAYNRCPRQQYFNRNFSGGMPQNRPPHRSPRRGCFVCGQVGCHTWFHENGHQRTPEEGGAISQPATPSSPPARDTTVRRNEVQHKCPICSCMKCIDPFCINQMRQRLNTKRCPAC